MPAAANTLPMGHGTNAEDAKLRATGEPPTLVDLRRSHYGAFPAPKRISPAARPTLSSSICVPRPYKELNGFNSASDFYAQTDQNNFILVQSSLLYLSLTETYKVKLQPPACPHGKHATATEMTTYGTAQVAQVYF